MNFEEVSASELKLNKHDFRTIDFVLYRALRLLLLPFGRRLSAKLAAHLHWIFRHLAIATSSNLAGVDFLNSRSAIVQFRLLEKHVRNSDSVVDVACGTARYFPILQSLGVREFLGIDSSVTHIENNEFVYPEAKFLLGNVLDLENLPACDVIIASHFLEHLDSPDLFLIHAAKLCKKIIVEVPDFYSDPVNSVSYILGAPWWTDRDHRREYSQELIKRLFSSSGYTIEEICCSGGTIGVVASPKSNRN